MSSNVKVRPDSSSKSGIVCVGSSRDGHDESEEDFLSKRNYLLLPWSDIQVIINSINDDSDQLKIYFACKGLKSILMVSSKELTK